MQAGVVLEQRDQVAVIVVDVAEEEAVDLVARDAAGAEVGVEVGDGVDEQVVAVVAQGEAGGGLEGTETGGATDDFDAEFDQGGGREVGVDGVGRDLFAIQLEIDLERFAAAGDFEDIRAEAAQRRPAEVDRALVDGVGGNEIVERERFAAFVFEVKPAHLAREAAGFGFGQAPLLHLLVVGSEESEAEELAGGGDATFAAGDDERAQGAGFAADKQVVVEGKLDGDLGLAMAHRAIREQNAIGRAQAALHENFDDLRGTAREKRVLADGDVDAAGEDGIQMHRASVRAERPRGQVIYRKAGGGA